jgi:hypothetical protein
MAITINHQTNDIHISEGSALTFGGAEMPTSGGGGGATLGTVTANDLDLATGNIFEVTAGNQTLTFSNSPAVHDFKLKVTGFTEFSGYQIGAASYDSVSFSFAPQTTTAYAMVFNNDGTKMYVSGQASYDIFQYTLTTPFNVGTASYDSVLYSFYPTTPEGNPQALLFNADGTKMYMAGYWDDFIYEHDLTTGFDLSTASYNSVSFDTSAQITGSERGMAFNNDGTKLYLLARVGELIYQYSMTNPYDISSLSYDSVSFTVGPQGTDSRGLAFNAFGTKMYVANQQNDKVYQYSLSPAFDLSSASYDSVSFSFASQGTMPEVLKFSSDGTKMFVLDRTNSRVYQYSTVGSTTAIVTYPSSVKFPASTPPVSPDLGKVGTLGIYTVDGGVNYFVNFVANNQN